MLAFKLQGFTNKIYSDGHGETRIPPYNFVAGGIKKEKGVDVRRSSHPDFPSK
jgi:hypothetical protein